MGTSTIAFSSVSERIKEFRHEFPDAIALSSGARTLSYAELDAQADQFANYLGHLGISAGASVVLCMERSFDWIVAALGIMRAGAAYVPLDSAWPEARIRYAVEDSGAAAMVARAELLQRLHLNVEGIDPSRDAAAILAAPAFTAPPCDADSLAYVIYTSGSTGVPKGVEITLANLENLILWHRDTFQVTPRDRASHLAGLGFDAAVWELWGNLCAGATLCLAHDAVRSSPELIQQWLIREHITISFVPTVHAASMITMVWPAETSLRFLLTGGEALLHAPPRPLPFAVINNYGPTECTVVATSSVVVPGSTGAPAIGRPIAGTRIYLLNEEGQQVSDDGIGEIYIGGKGLGRGYRNLPDATQWSFVSDPFAGIAGARMYRTGDRGKRRPNGEIEFRGRLDRQTKIRGQRIELDEIGSVLEGHPKIRFATAVVRRAARGEDQIVGYILPREDSTLPTTKELQEHLLQSLPEYMVPAVFVRLQALPLSPNGKIDLTALAAPSDENLLERPVAKTPSTPTEEKLLVLVRELLEQPAVTIEDNFFLAGGHSLLGMQLVMRLRNAFDVDLSLRELFESPTVERLAVTVERRQTEQRLTQIWIDLLTGPVVGLETSFFESGGNAQLLKTLQERIAEEFGKRFTVEELGEHSTIGKQAKLICHTVSEAPALPPGVLPLKTSTTRNAIFWVHYLSTNLARAMDDDQAFVHISLATEDIASLGSAPSMHDIAASLVLKILATQPKGPYMIGGYCIGGILAYEISSQLQASGHEVSLLILLDTPSPSYFESPNLLTPRLRHPLYLLKRIIRLGPKASFERIRKRLTDTVKARPARTEVDFVQSMIETAAASYLPAKYIGKVALILAEDHPPHIDFLSEWRLLVPNSLHTQYLLAHHSELMDESVVQTVANAMASQIKWVADEARLSESGGDDRLVESRAQANPVSDPIFG